MKKQILEYILRIFIFIILTGAFHERISTYLTDSMGHIFTILYEKFPFLEYSENAQILLSIIIGASCLFTACIGVTYFFAKICGLFKKLDGFKKWQSLLILLLITVFCCKTADICDKHRLISSYIIGGIGFGGLALIPSYLFYLFLNHLTKKFPVPFKKTGYICSIEFFKDLLKKLKSGH